MGGTVSTAQTIGHTLAGVKPEKKGTKKAGSGKKKQRITVMGNADSKCPICSTTNSIANSVYDLVNPLPKSAPKAKKDVVEQPAQTNVEKVAAAAPLVQAAAPVEATSSTASSTTPAISN